MGDPQRRGGTIQLQANGEIYDAKGEFEYNLGTPKRTAIIGADRPHGYKEEPQVPYIKGMITDRGTLDVDKLARLTNATITLELANGKVISLRDAYYAGDGTGKTGEGEFPFHFEGSSANEVT